MSEVEIRGLRELRSRLRRLDRAAPKALRTAGNRAADIVVTAARPRVPTGSPQGGHSVSSLRVASTQNRAAVRGGSRRYPYFGWLEFGGRVGRNRSVSRPFIKEGRFLFPAYHDSRHRVADVLDSELRRAARGAGLRVF